MDLRYHSQYGEWGVGWTIQGLNPNGQEIFLFSKISRPPLGPTQPSVLWTQGFLPGGGIVASHEVNHQLPHSTNIKNEWSYTSTPPNCLHDVDRENLKFYYYYLCRF